MVEKVGSWVWSILCLHVRRCNPLHVCMCVGTYVGELVLVLLSVGVL